MAPEQAQGQPVDARTDLFSLGVLYEMATARRAFGGDDIPLIVMKIINGIVVPPRAINDAVPPGLEAIIQKLMAVDPQQRYQTAAELLAAVNSTAQQLEIDARRSDPKASVIVAPLPRRRRNVLIATVAALVLAGGAAVVWTNRTPHLTDRDSIVIGQFENTTSDPVFDETLLTALKVHLGQSPFLDIIPDQRIRETLESMNRRAGDRLEHEVAREVCQRLSVKAMLEGSVAALGSHYVVTLTATDCQTGEALARTRPRRPARNVLTELGAISSSMRTKLGESLPSIRRFDVPSSRRRRRRWRHSRLTLGQEERRRGRELESVAFFNQAIENDREFAAAYITLSTVYGSLGEWRRSEEFAKRANAVTRPLSERERLLIAYQCTTG